MHRTRIKICGVTRPEDALAAANAGADAIGVVFHALSPRSVSPERGREIARDLPPFVTLVGLFVDERPERIREIAQFVGLQMIQLHGDESPEMANSLAPLPLIKAIGVDTNLREILAAWRSARLINLAGIVLETSGGPAPGGTGIANDWDLVERHKAAGDFSGLHILTAGGLTSENVGQVVRRLRPWAVDVSSGVEIQKGEKSADKMAAFVKAIREADAD